MRAFVTALAGVIIALVGVLLGAWWAPFLVGAALGLALSRGLVSVPLGALCGLLAWSLPLAAAEARFGLGPTATSLAAIMGFDHQGLLPLILTLVVGVLLGLSGAWLGSAARLLTVPARR